MINMYCGQALHTWRKEYMRHVEADREHVKQMGRCHQIGNTLWLTMSGSGIGMRFTGRYLEIPICGGYVAKHGEPDRKSVV